MYMQQRQLTAVACLFASCAACTLSFFVKPDDQTNQQRADVKAMTRLIELVTWVSLAISMLQVVIGATVSASQIADGSLRGTREGGQAKYLAVLVNTIEVGAILIAKLYSLYQW